MSITQPEATFPVQPSARVIEVSYLRRAGLVSMRQERSWNYYEIAPARSAFHTKLLECLGSCFHDVPEMTGDARRAQAVRKRGGCCPT